MEQPLQISPEDRRASEERLRARYEAGLAHKRSEALFGSRIDHVELTGTYPATLLVVVFRHELRPGCRFAWHWPLWSGKTVHLAEPSYDEHLWVYLMEWVHKQLRHHLDCSDGETVRVGILEPVIANAPPDVTG